MTSRSETRTLSEVPRGQDTDSLVPGVNHAAVILPLLLVTWMFQASEAAQPLKLSIAEADHDTLVLPREGGSITVDIENSSSRKVSLVGMTCSHSEFFNISSETSPKLKVADGDCDANYPTWVSIPPHRILRYRLAVAFLDTSGTPFQAWISFLAMNTSRNGLNITRKGVVQSRKISILRDSTITKRSEILPCCWPVVITKPYLGHAPESIKRQISDGNRKTDFKQCLDEY